MGNCSKTTHICFRCVEDDSMKKGNEHIKEWLKLPKRDKKGALCSHQAFSYALWCWYIYLQNWVIFRVHVGKDSIHGAYGIVI